MKNKLLTFFLALAVSVGVLFAQSGTCGANLSWTLDTESSTLTISGTGAMTNYTYSSKAPWYSYRESIKTVKIGSSVTSIGENAFWDCTSLTSITIPNSVISIGEYTFRGCSGLTSVTIPNSVTSIGSAAFSGCSGLTSVTIPNSITSIDGFSFYDCSGLTSVTIPNSVTSIGGNAFSGCGSLTSVIIPNSVTSIGSSAFSNVLNIVYNGKATGSPWGAKSVNGFVDGYFVYSSASKTNLLGCSTGTKGKVTIPNSVTSIGEGAFSGCSSLTSVIIPNSVTSIGSSAFCACSSLTSVTIPNSVTSIGEGAFYSCKSLTSVEIPNSVTSIGEYAFYNCSSLTSVEIPNSVTFIGEDAFYNCSSLTSVEIPNSVTFIGARAFYNCSSLTSVEIPNSVTYIGDRAFISVKNILYNGTATGSPWGAKINSRFVDGDFYYSDASKKNLLWCPSTIKGEITIPNSVTSIGEYAFDGCSGLTSVTIPNSVTSIGSGAFYGCSGLTSVTIPNSVTSIGSGAFYNVQNIAYSGIATGSPWGAKSVNGFVDGYLVYSDASKTNLLGCSTPIKGEVTIPNSVTSIGEYAFDGCSGLTSVTIPNSVTSIGSGAFYNVQNIAYSGIATGSPWGAKCVNGFVDGYLVYSDASKTNLLGCSTAIEGEVIIPNSVTSIGSRAFYECSSLISVTMESVTPPSVYTSSFPDNIIVYVPLGALKAYQETNIWKNFNLREFDTSASTSALYPTSSTITFTASINGENKSNYIDACGIEEGEEFSGNIAEYIGLEPESEYKDIPFYIRTTKGDVQNITVSFTTSALTLKTQQSQPVSANTAILLAETNMSDVETSCGFEWKRNDAPADMPATQVLCPVANGLMAGRLKGLKDDVYYKYRAFYKSAAGNMYYGDWQYIFTGDVTVEFDPILYTYAAQFVTERTATVKGYALAGSEDFTEQGFEYWADSRTANAPSHRAPQYDLGEKHTVNASGISMRVTLNDLDEGTVYKYRTYAKVGGKTLYGAEMTFTTQGTYEEPIVTDIESVDDAGEDDRTSSAIKVFENGQLYILLPNGTRYNLQGMEVK